MTAGPKSEPQVTSDKSQVSICDSLVSSHKSEVVTKLTTACPNFPGFIVYGHQHVTCVAFTIASFSNKVHTKLQSTEQRQIESVLLNLRCTQETLQVLGHNQNLWCWKTLGSLFVLVTVMVLVTLFLRRASAENRGGNTRCKEAELGRLGTQLKL